MAISNEIFKEMKIYRVERLDPHDWMHWFMTLQEFKRLYRKFFKSIWQTSSIQNQKY